MANVGLARLPDALRQEVTQAWQSNPHTRGTSVSLAEALALAEVVWTCRPERTLEVGLAHAGSAAAIAIAKRAAGLDTAHVALDPYQVTHSESRGLNVLKDLGLHDRVAWKPEWSETYLARAAADREFYDFIFVDGGHTIGQAVVDAFFSDRALRVGGVLAIDDVFQFSTAASVRYLLAECGYQPVPSPQAGSGLHTRLRHLKHRVRLGWRAVSHAVPGVVDAMIILRKTAEFRGGF